MNQRIPHRMIRPKTKAQFLIRTCSISAMLIISGIRPLLASGSYGPALLLADAETFWLWKFMGRLHPVLVHFPVSLLLVAAVLELCTLKNFHAKLRAGINALVFIGALSAVVAAGFGWLLASQEDYGGDTLAIHQWTGMATAAFGLVAAALLYAITQNQRRQLILAYRGVLLFTAIGVSVAGHFGGSLTHGNDYLTSVLPWEAAATDEPLAFNPGNTINFVSLTSDTTALSEEQEIELNRQVRAIFAHNCYSCHSAEKIKGELRLDTKKAVFKGGESGPVIVPGDTRKSELMRRITLPRNHKEAMPSKGKRLSEDEVALIGLWIEKGAPWPDAADKRSVFRVAALEPRMPELPATDGSWPNPVDGWVNEYFKTRQTNWPAPVDDRTYLRRIYLDIIGLLPTPDELDAFVSDRRPDKRALRVRQLLDRTDDYAMHWLSFWNDALRNDYTGTGYITGGRFAITDWLYTSLRTNKPYHQFVKELISPDKESRGFIAGIEWRGTVNASQRTEMQAAQNVAQVFLGLNLKCASCHDSFISDWKLADAYAFANIFADTTLEINRCDKPTGKFAGTKILWEELGSIDSTASSAEKLKQLADNLVQPKNGRLYRTVVNRIWAQLMGRGLVEPVDAMDNEPWSQDLLDWLATDFVRQGYDLKELIYRIATSRTYQLPSVGMKDANQIAARDFEFKGMLRRRMSAEQFADVVSQIIQPVFPDSALHFDPFKRSESGKPAGFFARASLVKNNSFLTALGRPNRETVSTSRESRANLLQALELTNGDQLTEVLVRGAGHWQQNYRTTDRIIEEIYRRALLRAPEPKETALARDVLGESPDTEGIQDLFWSVLLLPEFQIVY
jgi:mono/diheme cytochrome c family protein